LLIISLVWLWIIKTVEDIRYSLQHVDCQGQVCLVSMFAELCPLFYVAFYFTI
jgi:hypothetical protein